MFFMFTENVVAILCGKMLLILDALQIRIISGFEISGRQSYFATINFVLTTMTLNDFKCSYTFDAQIFHFYFPLAPNWMLLISTPGMNHFSLDVCVISGISVYLCIYFDVKFKYKRKKIYLKPQAGKICPKFYK